MTNIEIAISKNEIVVEMIGHAKYAEKGSDIVCAALSTLEYIVTGWCENNPEKAVIKKYDTGPGYTIIRILPIGNDVLNVIEAAVIGFQGIEERYPENIKLKKIQKEGEIKFQTKYNSN